ncbi:MAG: hypothetical protein AAGU19_19630, partial [Prolixibacteraceae bacterium]
IKVQLLLRFGRSLSPGDRQQPARQKKQEPNPKVERHKQKADQEDDKKGDAQIHRTGNQNLTRFHVSC